MRDLRTLRNVTAALAGAVLLAGAARALEADLPWDQAEATKAATQLSAAVDRLIEQGKLEERAAGFTPKALENYLLIEDLKQLKRHSKVLASQLEAGNGREETAGLFKRIQGLARDVAVGKRSSPILEGAQHEIDKTRELLDELTAYYEARTPPVAAPPSGEAPGK
jgi:hypothetical protein